MEITKAKGPNTTVTRDLREVTGVTGNIYESLAIVTKRANQISQELREELLEKLEEFAPAEDNIEEIVENREQIEISRHYERLPKPTLLATEEFLNGKVYYRNPSKELTDAKG